MHDLAEKEKQYSICQQDLRPIGEESSERYEYIPAQLPSSRTSARNMRAPARVKTTTKLSQPIEKSTAGASLLAQVIVRDCGSSAHAPARGDLRASRRGHLP